MSKTRRLKLPDGGSFDLAVPGEFGDPMFDASIPISRNAWIAIAAVGSAVTIVALIKILGK